MGRYIRPATRVRARVTNQTDDWLGEVVSCKEFQSQFRNAAQESKSHISGTHELLGFLLRRSLVPNFTIDDVPVNAVTLKPIPMSPAIEFITPNALATYQPKDGSWFAVMAFKPVLGHLATSKGVFDFPAHPLQVDGILDGGFDSG